MFISCLLHICTSSSEWPYLYELWSIVHNIWGRSWDHRLTDSDFWNIDLLYIVQKAVFLQSESVNLWSHFSPLPWTLNYPLLGRELPHCLRTLGLDALNVTQTGEALIILLYKAHHISPIRTFICPHNTERGRRQDKTREALSPVGTDMESGQWIHFMHSFILLLFSCQENVMCGIKHKIKSCITLNIRMLCVISSSMSCMTSTQ